MGEVGYAVLPKMRNSILSEKESEIWTITQRRYGNSKFLNRLKSIPIHSVGVITAVTLSLSWYGRIGIHS